MPFRLWIALQILGISSGWAVQAAQPPYFLDIKTQSLTDALNELAQQAGVQIVYFADATQGLRSNALSGHFQVADAMCQLLAGTGLGFERIDESTYTVRAFSDGANPCPALRRSPPEVVTPAVIEDHQLELEEVLVTAQKMIEAIQKAPVSIALLPGRMLESAGIDQTSALQYVAPGLQVLPTRSAANIYIRGIGSDHTGESSSLGVSYSIDGVGIARASGMVGLLYDVDRVEVVRGPQSTLYGANAIAGSVNVLTRQPVLQRELSGTLELGNYDLYKVAGVINEPIGDRAAVRLALQRVSHSGFTDSAPARDANDQDDTAARLGVRYLAAPNLSLTLTGDYFHAGGVGERAVPMDDDPRRDPLPATQDILGYHDNYGVRVRTDWSTGIGALTYIGAGRWDVRNNWFIGGASPDRRFDHRNAQQSHELRWFREGESYRWLLGAYAMDESTLLDDFEGGEFVRGRQYSDSMALYGQATWQVRPRVRLTGGLRYTRDRKGERTTSNLGFLVSVDNQSDVKWWYPNFRMGADFDLTADSLLYVNLANGFKAGGYNASSYNEHPTFGPEKLLSLEFGSKNQFLNRRLQLNLTAFSYRYANFHATYLLACECATDTINAQSATSRGVEVESIWLTSEYGRLGFSVHYLDAFYKSFVFPGGDYSGYPLSHAPRWTGNLNYRYVFTLGQWRLVPRIDLHGETKQSMTYDQRYVQQGYVRSDASVSLISPGERWNAQLYATNLSDETIVQSYLVDEAYLAPPRQVGVRVEFRAW